MSVNAGPVNANYIEAMNAALDQARDALNHDDVPVGAVVLHEGKIIAARHNERENLQDPTAHAEVLALQDAARVLGRWRLDDCTLVVTLEPCVMCAGAIATPTLLLSSGMGAVNPQIGVGLQDHPTVAFTMARADDDLGVFDASVHLKGATTSGGRFIVLAYERVSREVFSDALITVSLMTPTSRGAVQIHDGEISVNMNMLSTEADAVAMRESVRELLRICNASSVQSTTKSIVIDDRGTGLHDLEAMADLDLDQWIRGNLSFVSHASSSCSSAIDVDGGLRGFANVTIADASGLPTVPSETPAASVTIEATRIGRSLGGKLA